jgi:Flp pilus assembly pilin Flp
MWTMPSLCRRLRRCDAGATAIEYALLAALVAFVIIGSLRLTGGELSELFEVVATDFEAINDENAALLE